ncbi:unnamed protein product [Merluccius merluccius]
MDQSGSVMSPGGHQVDHQVFPRGAGRQVDRRREGARGAAGTHGPTRRISTIRGADAAVMTDRNRTGTREADPPVPPIIGSGTERPTEGEPNRDRGPLGASRVPPL